MATWFTETLLHQLIFLDASKIFSLDSSHASSCNPSAEENLWRNGLYPLSVGYAILLLENDGTVANVDSSEKTLGHCVQRRSTSRA